jgi:dTDP-4-dehydrorhamnose reductase
MIPAKYGGPRALIVGAQGQVGLQMMRTLEARRGNGRVLPTTRVARSGWLQLDLAELSSETQAASLLGEHPLDMVLCVGGMTHVDGCESEPELAYRVNARGPGVLAGYARQRGLPFVYFSTEYIFAGRRESPGPYTEDAPPQPLNVYGRTKWMGEREVLGAHPEALVVRTTVVYGPDDRQKNYIYSLMRNLSAGVPMSVPEDQISTPTYNRDLAQATLGLVEAGASGIFHVCGPEVLGRLEFARQVAKALGLDTQLLQGISTADLNQTAKRPLFAGLATSKLTTMYPNLPMRSLSESLEDCAAELAPIIQT